ncbi:MAG: HAD hydrolase family protein [bacterium]
MRRQFNTDCEGPITKNDIAFELSEEFIPSGGDFFAKISKYDDFLADIEKKPGYKAGDTLKLILPFFKAYGITELNIKQFSSKNLIIIPYADIALNYICKIMPSFIISTSYCQYINALCDAIGFPYQNIYCTELPIDSYEISPNEIKRIKDFHEEILSLPDIDIPKNAFSEEDLDDTSLKSIKRLDIIFWEKIANMAIGKLLVDINPIGGIEKARAIKQSCEITGIELSNVMYIGDSITDEAALKMVKEAGGIAISFNGNRYAVRSANIVCISPDALILAFLAQYFNEGKDIFELAFEWESKKMNINDIMDIPKLALDDIIITAVEPTNIDDLISKSESYRKTVRGERIGKLG